MTETARDAPETADDCMLCTRCLRTYADRRTCPVHGDEPLLDVRDDNILWRLAQEDDRLSRRLQHRWMAVGGLATGALWVGVAVLGWNLGAGFIFDLAWLLGWPAVCAMTLAGGALGRRRYRPRYAAWTRRLEPDASR